MPRLGRSGAALSISFALVAGLFLGAAAPVSADHCPPIDNPHPVPGQNTTYCHTPKPTAPPPTTRPSTPKPTDPPATAAPRTAAPGPVVGPTRTSSPSTPAPTEFDIEVPEEPLATTEIVVDPIDDTTEFSPEGANAGSASNWIFGFIVGFFLGGLFGRMSWGIRRRRRQQIFG